MSDDIAYLSATDLTAAFAAKSLSPVEAVEAAYDRIERIEPKINAFVHRLDKQTALVQAREAEARWQKGAPAGLLDGVPITVKDAIVAKGWATLRGSKIADASTPDAENAPSVARVLENGAIILGKTTTPEFGWKGVTDSPLSGITRNPWNLETTPGGSSGGSAAALAAGIGHVAIGTDAGGSVRIPGSFSGLVAIKASCGRVPNYPASAAGTLGHIGPMTHSVTDAALMLTLMSRPDARDHTTLPYEQVDYRDGLDDGVAGLRVAFSPTLGYAKVDGSVAALVADAVGVFEQLGARIEQIDAPFPDPTECFRTHFFAGISHALGNLPPAQVAELDPGLARVAELASKVTLGDYMTAMDQRAALSRQNKLFHENCDLLLTPTMAVPAFEAGRLSPDGYDQEDWLGWSPFTYPFNLTGQPAMTVPCGFTGGGLPVGLQIVGPFHQDRLVLRAARAYEEANPLTDRRPPID